MGRVLALGMVGVVLALGWAGCGGTDDTATTSDPAEQQVTKALTGYYAAWASGDVQRACGYLTAARRVEQIKLVNALRPGNDRVTSCADALNTINDAPGGRALLANVKISNVAVTGNSAKALAALYRNGKPSPYHYILTRTSDGWKVAPGSGETNATAKAVQP